MGGKIIIEFVAPRPKTYVYLDDDSKDHKKAEGTKKCVIKQKLMFENYKDCLINNKAVYRSQERIKSYSHYVYTEKVNKIVLSSMMIKDCKHLIRLRHIDTESILLRYVKVKC